MAPKTTLHLEKPGHAQKVAKAIMEGWAVVPFGATYGVAFHPKHRVKVAEVRGEDMNNLATVSVVAGYQDAIDWLDKAQLHPRLQNAVTADLLHIFESICFIRYPVNAAGRKHLHSYCINVQGGTQVFFVPPSDPIISALKSHHAMDYYAVRSSNRHGDSEKYTLQEAKKLAKDLEALAMAALGVAVHLIEPTRERIMSQPILELVAGQPLIKLVRAGSTHPDTMRALSQKIVDLGINFVHEEETKTSFSRPQFASKYTTPEDIRRHILKASGLLLY